MVVPEPDSLDLAFRDYAQVEAAFQEFLDTSLNPRGPESLFDLLGTLDLPAQGVAVDVGSGHGSDSLQLARRFALHVHGVDPVHRNVVVATAAAAQAGLDEHVRFQVGTAEAVPLPDHSVDLVWCKEVVTFTRMDEAFAEFRRVLKPGGRGLAYQVLTGPRMSDAEARQFWEVDLGYGEAYSVRPEDVEAAIAAAGLQLTQRIDFASPGAQRCAWTPSAPRGATAARSPKVHKNVRRVGVQDHARRLSVARLPDDWQAAGCRVCLRAAD
jgi:SAM-dependent methyltransferase